MKTKIIIRPDEDNFERIIELKNLIDSELVIIPKDMKILIKDKEGFWSVVK